MVVREGKEKTRVMYARMNSRMEIEMTIRLSCILDTNLRRLVRSPSIRQNAVVGWAEREQKTFRDMLGEYEALMARRESVRTLANGRLMLGNKFFSKSKLEAMDDEIASAGEKFFQQESQWFVALAACIARGVQVDFRVVKTVDEVVEKLSAVREGAPGYSRAQRRLSELTRVPIFVD